MGIKRSIATIVFVILVIGLIPMPFNEEQNEYELVGYIEDSNVWKFVRTQEGDFKGRGAPNRVFPTISVNYQNYMCIVTTPNSASYIEGTFVVPKRGTVFAYNMKFGHPSDGLNDYIELIDSGGRTQTIKSMPRMSENMYVKQIYTTKFDISPYVGQEVTIRIRQYPSTLVVGFAMKVGH